MSSEGKNVNRRTVLRGAAATAALVPLGGVLAACGSDGSGSGSGAGTASSGTAGSSASSGTPSASGSGGSSAASGGSSEAPAPSGSSPESSASGSGSGSGSGNTSDNPFGIKQGSSVDAVIFNGGYGYDYVQFAAKIMDKKWNTTTKVSPSSNIAQELQPRFAGGTPPDLVDNSGEHLMSFSAVGNQLETFGQLLDANNYEGKNLGDTLYPSAKTSGLVTVDGDKKFIRMNYAYTVYALWYSKSLFDKNSWTPPKTWDEAMDLGAKAKKAGKYLFGVGKEASTYFQTFIMNCAIKDGGLDVLKNLQALDKNAWSQPAIKKNIQALEKAIKAGYMFPGGAGTPFKKIQTKWTLDEAILMYPSGSWIENEQIKSTKKGFEMTGAPDITVSDNPKLGYDALNAAPGEGFIVPSTAKNSAGGLELLRAMLSKDAATNFSKTKKSLSVVKGTVPDDGFGSTALVSQQKLLSAAGDNTFFITFVDEYGINSDMVVAWNGFLSGSTDSDGLIKQLQSITDGARK